MTTGDPGQICSLCRVYLPAGKTFRQIGGHAFCLACAGQLGLHQTLGKRLGRLLGGLTPYRHWIGLAAVVCLAVILGTWGWAAYQEKQDDAESSRNDIRYSWAMAVVKLQPLLRMRKEITNAALRQARRDQLLVMSVGLTEEEARELLEAFATDHPESDKKAWLEVAYIWLGRELWSGRMREPIIRFFVRRYFEVPDREHLRALGAPWLPEVAAREEILLRGRQAASEYFIFDRRGAAALREWIAEADAGFITPPTREDFSLLGLELKD
jgi:hypothetical protein